MNAAGTLRGAFFIPVALALLLAACAGRSPGELATPGAARSAGEFCIERWQPQRLPGKRSTRYDVAGDRERPFVRARADASASLLRHRLRVEPAQLGELRFSWQVPALIERADVRQREFEDAPVRIVLAFDGDHDRLDARDQLLFDLAHTLTGERPPYATLMYVWDAQAPLESVVPGNRSSRVRKIVVESGPQRLAGWQAYRRDIVADYRRAFGEAPGALIGVALMTDADNTGNSAAAFYGAVCLGPASAELPTLRR